MRMSLRELLVLVALVGLAIVSLKYASEAWLAIVTGIAMLAFFVMLIVAAVDRGSRQAFAIGFALTMVGYWVVVTSSAKITPRSGLGAGGSEFDRWQGRLPTTRLLSYLHAAVDRSGYYDFKTGQELPDFDPVKDQAKMWGGGLGGGGAMVGAGGGTVQYRELPPSEFFMPAGHCWWSLLLGYIGGRFAQVVYARRAAEGKTKN